MIILIKDDENIMAPYIIIQVDFSDSYKHLIQIAKILLREIAEVEEVNLINIHEIKIQVSIDLQQIYSIHLECQQTRF